MEGNFDEFAEYLFNSTEDKIYIQLDVDNNTTKVDLFEFYTNLLIYGYLKFFNFEKLAFYFTKINIKLNYYITNEKIFSPFEITEDFKIKQNYICDDLFVSFKINSNEFIYIKY